MALCGWTPQGFQRCEAKLKKRAHSKEAAGVVTGIKGRVDSSEEETMIMHRHMAGRRLPPGGNARLPGGMVCRWA